MIAARLPQDQFDRTLEQVRKRLPWGSPDLDLILGHLQAVERENVVLRERATLAEAALPASHPAPLASQHEAA